MILYEDFILILIVLTYSYTIKCESCSTTYSIVNVNGDVFNVTWKTRHPSRISVVISQPPCLDINKNLVFRICSNGVWLPTKKCHYIDRNIKCPIIFEEVKEKCIFVTPRQTWAETCPYPGAWTIIDHYDNIWLPFKQTIPYGYYEYILPDKNYGVQYTGSDSSESSNEIVEINSECVAKINNKIEGVSCNEQLSHVCLYKYNHFVYRCPEGCVPGGLGSTYCFCKKYKELDSCNLAIPNYSYERNILYKLVKNDVCLIGQLQIFADMYLAIHKNALYLKTIDEINCAICHVDPIPFDDVDLDLKFNSNSNKLYLDVYSPEGLFQIDDEIQIFCFTDATDRLKYRVRVEKKHDSYPKSHTSRRYMVFKVTLVDDGPGYYWCEAFLLPSMNVIQSNKVVAYKKLKYNEYSLRINIRNLCRFSFIYCKTPSEDFISGVSKSLFDYEDFSKFIKNVRLFKIYDINILTEIADVLLHISVKSKLSDRDEYNMINSNFYLLTKENVTIEFFESSTHCFSETTIIDNFTLHWDTTPIDTIVVPKEVCVKSNGLPVTRYCGGDFHIGSRWERINTACASTYTISSKTQFLHSIVSGNISINSTLNISSITTNSSDLTVLDIHYLSKALTQLANGSHDHSELFVTNISQILNDLMRSNSSTLKYSQIILNATDELLDIFETTLNSAHFQNNSILLVNSDLIIHATKPFVNNISGISLRGLPNTNFLNVTITELYSNTTIDQLVNQSNLEIAVYFPENLLNILFTNVSSTNLTNITIITTVFYSDKFFNSIKNSSNETIGSKIVSVSISDYGDYLEEPITIIFKSKKNLPEKKCVFWNYGLRTHNHTGYWSTLGGDRRQGNSTDYEKCVFSHLTNFALLIKSEYSIDDDGPHVVADKEKYHEDVLSVISNVGCAFSTFGILGIFLTAALFQTWRKKVGTRILMQLCIAILLQIVFLNVATVQIAKTTSNAFCKITGIILHYVTIAQFAWMLVAAVLQFYRFVKVVGPMPNRIFLKASLLGWGFPLTPVVLACIIDIESYSIADKGICYPTGMAMYLGVLLPIVIIIIANLIVFIMVIRNIFQLKVESQGPSHTILKRQIFLAILLFFLLGLPWNFGLIAEVIQDSWLSYIFLYMFCFTATLQGFVLFIFYVILDKSTRTLWNGLVKKIIKKK